MMVLSREEATAWCQAHDVALYWGLPDLSNAEFKFNIPSDAQARVALVARAMNIFGNELQILVWFDNWAVWQSGQRMHVFDRFRMSYGVTQRLIDTPGHVFDKAEIEDAVSFVTIATLFLWDSYVVVPSRRKLMFLSHDEFGLSKGIELPESVRVPSVAPGTVRPHILPIWSSDPREPVPGDPVGCPVSVEEMLGYVNSLLPFEVQRKNLEFVEKGQVDASSYWLWLFYDEDGRRWNLCVFTGPTTPGGPATTWMCADNNPYDLSDRDYITAIHHKQY